MVRLPPELGVDSNTRNNRDSSTTPVRSDTHDLKLKITDEGARVQVGQVVTYKVTYENGGDSTAEAAGCDSQFASAHQHGSRRQLGWMGNASMEFVRCRSATLALENLVKLIWQFKCRTPCPHGVRSIRVDAHIAAASGVDKNTRNNTDPSFTPHSAELSQPACEHHRLWCKRETWRSRRLCR